MEHQTEPVAVAYAYPTSTQAGAMGRPYSGSWYVDNGDDFILADSPQDAANIAQQMIDGGAYHRSNFCMTHLSTWPIILERYASGNGPKVHRHATLTR
jgi:hypothetical protein